jgi:hypothetical protein
MANPQPNNTFTQHYLEITALEPASIRPEPPSAAVNPSLVITWPLIIFFGLFITGFLVLFFKRLHLFRSVLMVFVVAFLLSLLPLAMQTTSQRSQLKTLADADITPKNVIVSSVVPTGFVIEWDTAKDTAGGIKLSQSSDMQVNVFTYPDELLSNHHRLVVLNLKAGTTYYVQVLSDTTWFEHQNQPIQITLPSN